MSFKRWFTALSGVALVTILALSQSAQADVTFGGASAFGVDANVGLSATVGGVGVNATLSAGPFPTASGAAPPAFNNTNSAASASASASIGGLGVVGSLSTSILNVNAQSNVDGTAGAKTTSASATVNDLAVSLSTGNPLFPSLLNLGATIVQSTAQVSGNFGALTPTGTTTILGAGVGGSASLSVLGVDITALVFGAGSVNPAPNTTVTINDFTLGGPGVLTGSITVVLNEQIVTGNGSSTSGITVNAIDITFNNFSSAVFGPITLSGNILVSQSQAGQTAAPGGGGGGAQPVPEPSSLALGAVMGVAGVVARFKRRRADRQLESV